MGSFVDLVKRFHSDERGVFAVLFGIFAIVLIAAAGAVVDFTSVEQARTSAQQALDAAALGLQPTIYDTPTPTQDALKAKALALLEERLADSSIDATVDVATVNLSDGTLHLEGSITVPTAFVQLIGFPTVRAKLVSEATRKRLNLEVAMVLDNSLSMKNSSRMTNLKTAATCAINVLLNGITDCDTTTINATKNLAATAANVKIGIVPFTEFVNVGNANKTAAWMDKTGASSIANDNFDSDDNAATVYTGLVNRFSLYTAMNTTWRGCVEARKYPYDTNDTTPSTATPDTLFVPELAPDEPDSGYGNSYLNDRPSACTGKDAGTWVEKKVKTNCSSNFSGTDAQKLSTFNACSGTATTTRTSTKWDNSSQTAAATQPATLPDKNGVALPATCTPSYTSQKTQNSPARYSLTYLYSCSYNFPDRVLQERMCKYTGSIDTSKDGPNQDCPTNALTPLTTTKATLNSAITAMSPQGFTNIHQGAIWGFHMLSPGEPLTALDYDTATSKVMIVMTDGENTVDGYSSSNMNKSSGFFAYGYPGAPVASGTPYNGRIYSTTYPTPASDAQVTAAMDTRTVETCTNAKAEGITVYTIGLSAPNQKTIDMLTACATDDGTEQQYAFFPTDSSQLTPTFKKIADQLSNLRLSE